MPLAVRRTSLGSASILNQNLYFEMASSFGLKFSNWLGDVVDYVDLSFEIIFLITDIRPQTIPFSNK